MLKTVSKYQAPLLFAIITIAAYGLLLPFTGFYWDDWPFAWIAKFLGPAEFNPAFAPFRPFLGPIFYFTTSLIPPVPLYWQIFALVIRFLIGVGAFWAFKQIFPKQQRIAFITTLLILVFPGYSQHWVALTHINQELIPFIFYLFSFGFTFKALRDGKTVYAIIALLLQVCGIFPTEYFFGLEGLRFLFLFFFFDGTLIERFIKTLKIWWPYLLIWMLNAAWLVYYYKFGPYNSYEVNVTQSFTVLMFLKEALDALWKAGFYIWIQVLTLTFSTLSAPASLLSLGLAALSLALLTPYLLRFAPIDEVNEKTLPISLIIIGLIGILLGRLPSLAASLPLTLQSSFDRFMVSMMIGGSLFVIGLVELLVRNSRAKLVIFSVLISLGIGQQFFNANIFRRDWEDQKEIYWQMTWRMPALKPNTVLLTDQMPIDYETDLSFTAPINWMYAPEYTRSDLPYILLYTEKRIGGGTLPSFEPDVQIFYPYRTVNFKSSTSNAVVMYMPRNGCLRVLDPARGDRQIYAKLPAVLTQAIPLSDPSRIIADTEKPAIPMFFSEPEHEWCYYFTKAGLAQQQDDYAQVVSLGNDAMEAGYKPQDQNEWLVFIDAYARVGDFQTAGKLSVDALAEDVRIRRGVCTVWEQIQAEGGAGGESQIMEIMRQINCNP
ncbi:MAG: hypothetical protein IH588_03695 [Anaerolineales bacterium]|nr:hypothetical protein [Anaerolineales bacterium]